MPFIFKELTEFPYNQKFFRGKNTLSGCHTAGAPCKTRAARGGSTNPGRTPLRGRFYSIPRTHTHWKIFYMLSSLLIAAPVFEIKTSGACL